MFSKINFWNAVSSIIAINFLFFLLEFLLYTFNYKYLLNGISLFTITSALLILFYYIIKYSRRLSIEYVDENLIDQLTKEKILKEDKYRNQIKYLEKKFLKEIKKLIKFHIVILGIYEFILLTTILFNKDFNMLLDIILLTFPALLSLFLCIYSLFKKFLNK